MQWYWFNYVFVLASLVLFSHMPKFNATELLMKGDLQLGALVSVHQSVKQEDFSVDVCGDVLPGQVLNTEIMRLSVEHINKNFLKNSGYQLGLRVLDACNSRDVAIRQSVALMTDGLNRKDTLVLDNELAQSQFQRPFGIVSSVKNEVIQRIEPFLDTYRIPLVSVVTADRKLKSENYPHLLNMMPSNNYQAEALLSLLDKFKWCDIVIVNDASDFGLNMRYWMESQTQVSCRAYGAFCEVKTIEIQYETEALKQLVNHVNSKVDPPVVVLLMTSARIRHVCTVAKTMTELRKLQFIIVNDWDGLESVSQESTELIESAIALDYHRYPLPFLQDYFNGLTFGQVLESGNPWLISLIAGQNCSSDHFDRTEANFRQTDHYHDCPYSKNTRVNLTGIERVVGKAYVIYEAILMFATAAEKVRQTVCSSSTPLCTEFLFKLHSELFETMRQTITYDEQLPFLISFQDSLQQPVYSISQYQKTVGADGITNYDWVQIGKWSRNGITVSDLCCTCEDCHRESNYSRQFVKSLLKAKQKYYSYQNPDSYQYSKLGLFLVSLLISSFFGVVLRCKRQTPMVAVDCGWVSAIGIISVNVILLTLAASAGDMSDVIFLYKVPLLSFFFTCAIAALFVNSVRMSLVSRSTNCVNVTRKSLLVGFALILTIELLILIAFVLVESCVWCRSCTTKRPTILMSFYFIYPTSLAVMLLLYLFLAKFSSVLCVYQYRRNYILALVPITAAMVIHQSVTIVQSRFRDDNIYYEMFCEDICMIFCSYAYLIVVFTPRIFFVIFKTKQNTVEYLAKERRGTTVSICGNVFEISSAETQGTSDTDIFKKLVNS